MRNLIDAMSYISVRLTVDKRNILRRGSRAGVGGRLLSTAHGDKRFPGFEPSQLCTKR